MTATPPVSKTAQCAVCHREVSKLGTVTLLCDRCKPVHPSANKRLGWLHEPPGVHIELTDQIEAS